MKNILLCLALLLLPALTFAQNTDSLVYQHQRNKINAMLDARIRKFSQYTQSLDMHTGIFGLQTKKDIRRSNEILMDITHADNDIFKELKILLDYKTFQQTQVSSRSHDDESRILGYMTTINKLREQMDTLKIEQARVTKEYQQRQTVHIIVIILLILLSVFLIYRKRRPVNAI